MLIEEGTYTLRDQQSQQTLRKPRGPGLGRPAGQTDQAQRQMGHVKTTYKTIIIFCKTKASIENYYEDS